MRTLIDLPEDDMNWLDHRASEDGKSRAALIREAIAAFRNREDRAGMEKYFGLWARHGSHVDGLAYERRLRDEWNDRDLGGKVIDGGERDAA